MENKQNDLILDIQDLRVIYKTDLETVSAVNGIDLKIGKGKTFGLVGETGAGKTTTALSILRLLPSNTGKILGGKIVFNGKDLLDMDEHMMHAVRGNLISMVFQDPMSSLNPVYTVDDQIGEAIRLHNPGISNEEVEKRVDDMLQLVGIIASRKHEYPHQFSGGMKQRVVIAMALFLEPRVIIMDEPTTALDVIVQAQILNLIKDLKAEQHISYIFITHDLATEAEVADRVMVMYAGKAAELASGDVIFGGRAMHPYTQKLLASTPRLKRRVSELAFIPGSPPDLIEPPAGCRFAPRCPDARARCRCAEPPFAEVGPGHSVACWKALEDPDYERN